MGMTEGFVMELEQESVATKGLLELVPGDKLNWKPHDKSMTLGQLALHVASIPGNISELVKVDEIDSPDLSVSSPDSVDQLLPAFEESVAKAKSVLESLSDEQVGATWRLTAGGKELMAMPKALLIRAIMLNHWYHHRGQLTVYLRLLEIPLPSVYGPTADVNPFA